MTAAPDIWLRRFLPTGHASVWLVCFPHAGGAAGDFRRWAGLLPPEVGLLAVRYPGREERIGEPYAADLHRLADQVYAALEPLLDRPVALFGHSLGAAAAFEVGLRVQERQPFPPSAVVLSGCRAPHLLRSEGIHLADDDTLMAEVYALGGADTAVLDHPELRELALPALRADFRLIETYRPRPGSRLNTRVAVCVGDGDPEVSAGDARAWEDYAEGDFELRVFPGGHFYLADRPADLVAEVLRQLG
ncbi:alpha/beta fold hydrolase [Nonomuraea sp. NPDC050404]|uniref:thioesterase II family protein n=1 Tax=Nonomuraea sp. NPDC050404 TaxID=3155783 RepID=UPI0033DAE8BF